MLSRFQLIPDADGATYWRNRLVILGADDCWIVQKTRPARLTTRK